jgi:hypothetical protein
LQQQESCHIYRNQCTFKREVEQFGWCVGLVQKYKLSTSFVAKDAYSRLFLSPWIVNLRYSSGIFILIEHSAAYQEFSAWTSSEGSAIFTYLKLYACRYNSLLKRKVNATPFLFSQTMRRNTK